MSSRLGCYDFKLISVAQNSTSAASSAAAAAPTTSTSNSTFGSGVGFNPNVNVNASLPQFTYNLTSLDDYNRNLTCSQQISACAMTCASNTTVNFCNNATMGFNCQCSDPSQTLPGTSWQWPINQQACVGSRGACQAVCSANFNYTVTPEDCSSACIIEYQTCGTPQQMPFYYEVQHEGDIPGYNTSSSSTSAAVSVNSNAGWTFIAVLAAAIAMI